MDRKSLVAINIVLGDKLINPKHTPILFYWDGEGDLENIIYDSQEIKNILVKNIHSLSDYNKTSIAYFYFYYNDEGHEQIVEEITHVAYHCTIDEFGDSIYEELTFPIFQYLYKCSFKEDYTNDTGMTTDDIKDIYNQLKEKYPDRISLETVINYVRKKLGEQNIEEENKELIVDKLKNIL